MDAARAALIAWLHRTVPEAPRPSRKALLALKRDVYAGRMPRARTLADVRAAAGPTEAALLDRWVAEHERAAARMRAAEPTLQAELAAARRHLGALARRDEVLGGIQLSGRSLRRNIRPSVELVELDMHINDPEFAAAVAERLLELLKA